MPKAQAPTKKVVLKMLQPYFKSKLLLTVTGFSFNLHNFFFRMTGLKTLNLNDEGVAMVIDETLLAELKQKTSLKAYNLSKATTSLLKLISQANTSISMLRNVIKSYELPSDEPFDTVLHADVNFIETVGLYL